ncbi:MAG: transcription antitermination factor NusB [Defluviitaleaceae bacterium]|nr:transcription antitermination factor NusB [Defluviitaleaceae bacterium]
MSRRDDRILAFQLAFGIDFHDWENLDETVEYILEEFGRDDTEGEYIYATLSGISRTRHQADDLISRHSKDWDIERLNRVDLAILRLAIYEMIFSAEIPESVAINEAVDISKEFSGDEGGRFINGILGNISREGRPI